MWINKFLPISLKDDITLWQTFVKSYIPYVQKQFFEITAISVLTV